MRTWWKALARLRAAGSGARQAAARKVNSARPVLEQLEGRTLLSSSPGQAIVGSFTRYLNDPLHPSVEVGVSRFDPHTGHETVLFSKQVGMYDTAGPVAVAADGDVLFALTESSDILGTQDSVRRIDAHTGKVSTLFTTMGLDDLATGSHGEVVASWSRDRVGVSRFDPHTGHETVLFSKQTGMYEGMGPVAVAADGDVLFALTEGFGNASTVERYNAVTGKTSELFSVHGYIDSLAVKADGAVIGGYTTGGSVRVSRFDPKTGHEDVLFSKPLGLYDAGTADVAVASDGNVLVALRAFGPSGPQDTVRQIDAHTGKATTLFSASGLEDIAVAPVAPPVAVNDSYSVNKGTTLAVGAAAGVLKNDTDPAGDHLTASLVHGPAHGTLLLRLDGSFRYTPRAGFTGTDSFTYEASDGSLASGPATVTIHVNASHPHAQV